MKRLVWICAMLSYPNLLHREDVRGVAGVALATPFFTYVYILIRLYM